MPGGVDDLFADGLEYAEDMLLEAPTVDAERHTRHYASKVEETDYNDFDYFICMDDKNVRNLSYIFDDPKNKVYKLLSKDIADPWYTGNFDLTYDEIVQGINYLISDLKSK